MGRHAAPLDGTTGALERESSPQRAGRHAEASASIASIAARTGATRAPKPAALAGTAPRTRHNLAVAASSAGVAGMAIAIGLATAGAGAESADAHGTPSLQEIEAGGTQSFRADALAAAGDIVASRTEVVQISEDQLAKAKELSANATPATNRALGRQMAAERGWTGAEWTCLDKLWTQESGWNHLATNRSSGAYGIPQAYEPGQGGAKMASAGADWQFNPATQIQWGLDYIERSYGSPCAVWNSYTNTY